MAGRTTNRTLRAAGFDVEVVRGDVRSVRLGVRPDGTIRVSAPRGTPDAFLVAFVDEHRAWLLAQRDAQRLRQPPREDLGDGGRLLLWGRWYEVVRRVAARGSAQLEDGRVLVAAPDDDAALRAVDRLRRKQLEEAVKDLSPRLEAAVGQRPTAYRFRKMTSRWGVCDTRTRVITVNTWLVQRPVTELEYLLVHELAHLVERGHGPAFRAVVAKVLPDWQQRRRSLQATLPPRR